jgi:hypothetical protein
VTKKLVIKEVRMTNISAAPPANFNLAVETLKRTLRQDKVAAVVLSQAQAPQEPAGPNIDVSAAGSISNLGRYVNTDA